MPRWVGFTQKPFFPIAGLSADLIRRAVGLEGHGALVLASLGVLVSTYHYLLEWFPQLETNVCSVDVPCTSVWFRGFGFVSLALMAGLAGVFVIVVSAVLVAAEKSSPVER